MTSLAKLKNFKYCETFSELLPYKGGFNLTVIGSDGDGGQIDRMVLGAVSPFLKTAVSGIDISQLDQIIIPDVTGKIIRLMISLLYHGTAFCMKADYMSVLELMQILCIKCRQEGLVLADPIKKLSAPKVREQQVPSFDSNVPDFVIEEEVANVELCSVEIDKNESHDVTNKLFSKGKNVLAGSKSEHHGKSKGAHNTIAKEGTRKKKMETDPLEMETNEICKEEELFSGNPEELNELFNCSKCDKSFLSPAILNRHICEQQAGSSSTSDCTGLTTSNSVSGRLTCSVCSKTFTSSKSVINHQKLVHGVFPVYTCKVCQLSFICHADLQTHRTVHKKAAFFSCDKCSFQATKNCYLMRHIRRVHNKEKPHVCGICQKRYPDNYTLKLHEIKNHKNV